MRSTGRVTPKGYFVYQIVSELTQEEIDTLTRINNGYKLNWKDSQPDSYFWSMLIHPTNPDDLNEIGYFKVVPDYVQKNGRIGAVFFDKEYALRVASFKKFNGAVTESEEEELPF